MFDEPHQDVAATWIGLGRLGWHAGEFDSGREWIERAIELRTVNSSAEDFDTLRATTTLGRLEFYRGDYAAAERALRRSLDGLVANDGG